MQTERGRVLDLLDKVVDILNEVKALAADVEISPDALTHLANSENEFRAFISQTRAECGGSPRRRI